MKRIVAVALAGNLVVGSVLAVAVVQAAPFTPPQRFALSGQAGLASIAMGQVNDDIETANAFLSRQNWTKVDALGSAFVFQADLRVNLLGPWMVAAGLGRSVSSSGVDFDQVIDVKPSASIYRGTVFYQLPYWVKEKIRFAVGGGIDYASSAELEISHEHRNVETGTMRIESLRYEGSGWGGHAMAEIELLIGETVAIVSDVGWRQLNVASDSYRWKIERVTNPDLDQDRDDVPNGEDLSDQSFLRHGFLPSELVTSPGDIRILEPSMPDLDFSGAQANVGLRFYMF